MSKKILFLILIVFLSLLLVWPFFRAGYFPTHDGEWAVVRLGAMHRAVMAGQLPVRWAGSLNFSYGYPLFLFTYPLPYYLGEIFNLAGFGLVGSVKILFVLSVIFSGLAMYWLGKEIWGKLGGFITAVFYLYAPFRLVDLYVRGSLGESLAFVFYPLLFLSILKIVKGKGHWLPLVSIFSGGLILTHNVSALIFMPFLVAFLVFEIMSLPESKRRFALRSSLAALLLGFGLAAFFLLPALGEKRLISLSQIPLSDRSKHFVSLSQLIFSKWGYGNPGETDAFSFQLGWVHLLALLITIILSLFGRKKLKDEKLPILKFLVFSFLSLVFLTIPVSNFFWQNMPLFSEVDFPWRALGPATFFVALSLGYLAADRRRRYLGIGLLALVILFNYSYAKPSAYIDHGDDYYLTNEATTTSADELMPIWVRQKPIKRASAKVELISGEGTVSQLFQNGKKVSFNLENKSKSTVRINTIYFPGWQVKADDQLININFQNGRGLITFEVFPGSQKVVAEFKETAFWLTTDIISLFSLLLVILYLVKFWKNK